MMPSPDQQPTLTVVDTLREIAPDAWDRLCGDDNPFVEHAFLYALERSGSVGARTGWYPQYMLLTQGDRLTGALPLYLKDNSYGEYIFDWAWANGAHRAGLPYYPKLVAAVPFTPASGPRLLVGADEGDDLRRRLLVAGATQLTESLDLSSLHVLFCTQTEQQLLTSHAFLPRLTYQYHWTNAGYADFEAYLRSLRSAARKRIRRERRRAAQCGLEIRFLPGEELTDGAWCALYRFYRRTVDNKWGSAYLTESFFSRLREDLPHRVRVALASRKGRAVAAALYFQKGDHLYGRYWGSDEPHDCLHFELCYYRAIEHCIAQRLTRFEAGAQGEHKIKRGLLPHPTYSAHLIRHPELRRAIGAYLQEESQAHRWEMDALGEHSPFRRDAMGPARQQGERL